MLGQWMQGPQTALLGAYAPPTPGNTVMEKLQFKKKALELDLQRTNESLDFVNRAIAKLEADPNLDSILSLLGKANIL